MADFEAVTASNGVRIPNSQRQKLQDLIKEYDFGEVTGEVDNEGYLYIYGYEWLQAHHPAAEPSATKTRPTSSSTASGNSSPTGKPLRST